MPFWKETEFGVQGEPCANLYLISRGQVLLSRRARSGAPYALYLLGPGELFGEGSLRPERAWLVTARAVSDGVVHVLPAAQLPRFAQYFPELTAQIVSLLAGRLERAHRRLDVLTSDSAQERVMGLLRMIAGYHGVAREGALWVPLGVTQAELGDMIGLTRETVTRTLAELQRAGLIRRERRKGYWLLEESGPQQTDVT